MYSKEKLDKKVKAVVIRATIDDILKAIYIFPNKKHNNTSAELPYNSGFSNGNKVFKKYYSLKFGDRAILVLIEGAPLIINEKELSIGIFIPASTKKEEEEYIKIASDACQLNLFLTSLSDSKNAVCRIYKLDTENHKLEHVKDIVFDKETLDSIIFRYLLSRMPKLCSTYPNNEVCNLYTPDSVEIKNKN